MTLVAYSFLESVANFGINGVPSADGTLLGVDVLVVFDNIVVALVE